MAEATEKSRTAIAKREWIDKDGNHTPDRTKAIGARYTYLKSGNSVERKFVSDDPATVMSACMGWLTKVGNIVNSVVHADDYDGTTDPMQEAIAWDGDLGNGVWREPTEGGAARGPKYDKDTLAGALLATLTAKGIAKGDLAAYRTRLDDKSYYAKVRANTEVMAQYYKDVAAKGGEAAAAPDASGLA